MNAEEGDVDFRGRSASPRTPRSAFIRRAFELDSDAPQAELDTLMKLTERYCVVLQTLRRPPAIETCLARA